MVLADRPLSYGEHFLLLHFKLESISSFMEKKKYVQLVRSISIAILLLLTLPRTYAQEGNFPKKAPYDVEREGSRHSIHGELLGRAFLFGSLNYEYAINRSFSVCAGIGVTNVQSGTITRDNNGQSEEGRYFDSGTSQMIFGNYFVGKHRHKGFVTAGVTHFLITSRNKYPSETVRSAESNFEWNAGLGYQFAAKRTYYRVTGYVVSLPEPSAWFPPYMPWGGLTVGVKLF